MAIQETRQMSNFWIAASAYGLLAMTMGAFCNTPRRDPPYRSGGCSSMATSTPEVTPELSV
jgi:hypothetical protein